jgi:hypothetical protein
MDNEYHVDLVSITSFAVSFGFSQESHHPPRSQDCAEPPTDDQPLGFDQCGFTASEGTKETNRRKQCNMSMSTGSRDYSK